MYVIIGVFSSEKEQEETVLHGQNLFQVVRLLKLSTGLGCPNKRLFT
jgi:hypothetical protein